MEKEQLAYCIIRNFLRNYSAHRIVGYSILIFSMFTFGIMPFLFEIPRAGHDIGFHIGRILAIAHQLSQGIVYSKINYWFGDGIGYASSLGYPDLFLYIPALLVRCGVKVTIAYQIFLLCCSVITLFTMYIALRSCQLSRDAAFFGAVLYCISPYHIYCMVVRAAVGEILAFAFFPLIAAGAYNCIHNKGRYGYLLCIGFAGMALSHVLSLIIAIFFFLIYAFLNIHCFFKNIRVIALNLGVAVCISAFFWMPLLEFYFTNNLYMHYALATTDVYAIDLKSLFIPSLQPDKLFFGLPIYLAALFFLYRKDIQIRTLQLFGIAVVILLCTTSLFPFWGVQSLAFIQFPWRLFGIVSLFMTFSFALLAERFFSEKRYEKPCCVALVFFFSISIFLFYIVFKTQQYNPVLISKTDFGWGSEFLPYNARRHSLTKEDIRAWIKENKPLDLTKRKFTNFSKNPSTEYIHYKHDNTQVDITVLKRIYIDTVQTRLLYYTGYKAWAYDSNGKVFNPAVVENTDDGFCSIILKREFKGTIVVKYESSPIQLLSYIITAATVFFLLIQGGKKLFNMWKSRGILQQGQHP